MIDDMGFWVTLLCILLVFYFFAVWRDSRKSKCANCDNRVDDYRHAIMDKDGQELLYLCRRCWYFNENFSSRRTDIL